MPELNPTAVVTGPAPAAPVRGTTAATPEESGAPAFGTAMAQAKAKVKRAAKDEPTLSDKAEPADPRGARKPKALTDAKLKLTADDDPPKDGKAAVADEHTALALPIAAGPQPIAASPQPIAAPAGAVEEDVEAQPIVALAEVPKRAAAPGAHHIRSTEAGEVKTAAKERALPGEAASRAATQLVAAQRADRDTVEAPATPIDDRRTPDVALPTPALVQRDRLSEDFQQRFERALTGATATAARNDAGAVHSSAAPAWGASTAQPARNDVTQIAVPAAVGTPAFTEDLSNRVAMLTRGRVHSAELTLTPADLGPVSVSIEVRGTDATRVFGAAHAATRSALEEALPRLREMLDAQGLQLADARVGGGDAGERDARQPRPGRHPVADQLAASGAVAITDPRNDAGPRSVRPIRLIDVIV